MELLVNIDVEDLERAIAFYTSALSLQLSRRLFQGRVAEMLGGSSRIYLLENQAGTSATAVGADKRHYGRHWTPVHLDFVVDDIEAATKQATKAGANSETPVQRFPWGSLCTLSDPFGNGFCLVQFQDEVPYLEGN